MREELYKQHILDHYAHPRNKGVLSGATHRAKGSNPSCGDVLILSLAIKDGKLVGVGFEGIGCAISQASASMLTEKLIGMPVESAQALTEEDIYAMLGIEISPAREKCALLALRALRSSLREEAPQSDDEAIQDMTI